MTEGAESVRDSSTAGGEEMEEVLIYFIHEDMKHFEWMRSRGTGSNLPLGTSHILPGAPAPLTLMYDRETQPPV
ncbi:unnamed protein product [Arctogadus glacialis]